MRPTISRNTTIIVLGVAVVALLGFILGTRERTPARVPSVALSNLSARAQVAANAAAAAASPDPKGPCRLFSSSEASTVLDGSAVGGDSGGDCAYLVTADKTARILGFSEGTVIQPEAFRQSMQEWATKSGANFRALQGPKDEAYAVLGAPISSLSFRAGYVMYTITLMNGTGDENARLSKLQDVAAKIASRI